MLKIKRALISVSDKEGIADFAKELNALGIENMPIFIFILVLPVS